MLCYMQGAGTRNCANGELVSKVEGGGSKQGIGQHDTRDRRSIERDRLV